MTTVEFQISWKLSVFKILVPRKLQEHFGRSCMYPASSNAADAYDVQKIWQHAPPVAFSHDLGWPYSECWITVSADICR